MMPSNITSFGMYQRQSGERADPWALVDLEHGGSFHEHVVAVAIGLEATQSANLDIIGGAMRRRRRLRG
jgi:hypothetical protein